MTTGDIKLIREFVAAISAWEDEFLPEYKSKPCAMCGAIPSRLAQLGRALKALLEAYDAKKQSQPQ